MTIQLPARPTANANKATWVSYLAAHGMSVDEARGLSKNDMYAKADRIEEVKAQARREAETPVPERDRSETHEPDNDFREGDIVDAEVVDERREEHIFGIPDNERVVQEGVYVFNDNPHVIAVDNPNPSDPGVPVNSARGGFLNIQDAILEVMKVVGAIGKSELNRTPGASYNFRGVDTVIKAVSPAFKMFGVTISPRCLSVNTSRAPKDTNAGGVLLWADVLMEYTLTARDGSERTWSAPGAAMDSGDKAIGKACSVAYRIAMLQGLCIPTDEPDPDSVSYGEDDGYQTHGRGGNTNQHTNERQRPAQPQQDRHQDYRQVAQPTEADKIREYTMNVLKEYELDGRHIRQKYADMFNGADWFQETDLDRLKSFGKDMRDNAIQDRAMEEQQAVANVIGGLGATVVPDDAE